MDLDRTEEFNRIDSADMMAHIEDLPDQLERAWNLGMRSPLPDYKPIDRVLVVGMGGSAIGADLLAAYVEPFCKVPIIVQRDYDLPGWARGDSTLVIGSSHSGNTEETLTVFEQAGSAGCQRFAVTTGGSLSEIARSTSAGLWMFEHHGMPRSAVGYSFGLLLALLYRLDLIPDPANELRDAVSVMKAQQAELRADVPVNKNPAKRLAGQLVGRGVIILGSGVLAPVTRRWKGQLNELAKAWATFDLLPEANHNTIAGAENPVEALEKTYAVFLRAPSEHAQNKKRSQLTAQAFMLAGIVNDSYNARGSSRMAQQWSALHFGDYTAYYLAMIYGMDPTPIAAIQHLKQSMQD